MLSASGLVPAGRVLVDWSPEFKGAQASLLCWGYSSLCPGPLLFPGKAVGLEEENHLPQMVLSRGALLNAGSSLPIGDLDSHAGVSSSWDTAFPGAPLPSRTLGPACWETAKLRGLKGTLDCAWSYQNTELFTSKGSPEFVRAWTEIGCWWGGRKFK